MAGRSPGQPVSWGCIMKGLRTYIAAAVTAAAGVIAVATMPDTKAGWTALGMAVLMAMLRSITTTPPGQSNSPMFVGVIGIVVAAALALGGCTAAQLNASANVLATIGVDLVKIECNGGANLIQIVASDVGAVQRVQNALNVNVKVATDACPTLAAPAIAVLTQAAAAAKAASGG